jgi:hypothetical protein
MSKVLDYLRLKLGMWIAYTGRNKTATQASIELSNRIENMRCVHCGKNPYFIDL